eukprot:m.784339 g.784339  ORF g.784339 m.784339 type:complete len:298 (+) comp23298_c3_seq1:92-985(+)
MDAALLNKYRDAEAHMAQAKNAEREDLLAQAMYHYTEGITLYLDIAKFSVVHRSIQEFVDTNQIERKARDYTSIAENVKRILNQRISSSWETATRTIKEAVDHDVRNRPEKAVEGYRKGCEVLVMIASRYLCCPQRKSGQQFKQVYSTVDSYICRAEFLEAVVREKEKRERDQQERASNIRLLESGGEFAREATAAERRGDYRHALQQYKNAVSAFMEYLQNCSSNGRTGAGDTTLKQHVSLYLDRIALLQRHLHVEASAPLPDIPPSYDEAVRSQPSGPPTPELLPDLPPVYGNIF